VENPELSEMVMADPRFLVDEIPLLALVRRALPLDWARDPFDRMLVAHSAARRLPSCSLHDGIRANHRLLVRFR
jgi:PIN domain nuclease of toxin-antitoxin system